MPEVQIRLSSVDGDVTFTMLIGIEGARIYIDVGVK